MHRFQNIRAFIIVTLGLFALFFPAVLHAQNLSATVRVMNAKREPIFDAQVIVQETGQVASTNQLGEARINVPRPGFYTVRVITPDGQLVQPSLQILAQNQVLPVFTAEPEPEAVTTTEESDETAGQGVTVRGVKEKTKVSRYQVRLDEVKRIPGQFGEALRGIESLPGVTAPPFGNGDIVLRGANADANVYLVDDLPVGYAFHLFPVNSVLHNDLIQTIDIYTGAYPAYYGDATGGIISIETIDEVEKFGGHTSFALWSANALFKGPFLADGMDGDPDGNNGGNIEGDAAADATLEGTDARTTTDESGNDVASESTGLLRDGAGRFTGYWIGAARGSYMHKTLASFAPDGVRLPIYWDAQFKLMYRLAPEHTLYLYALGAKDTFGAEIEDKQENDPTKELDPVLIGARLAFDRAFHTEAVRYEWQPGSLIRNRLTLIGHDNIIYVNGEIGDLEARQEQHDGYLSLRDDLDWELVEEHVRIEAGFELRQFRYTSSGFTVRQLDPNDESPDFFNPDEPDFETIPVEDSTIQQYNSGYAMLTLAGYGFEFKPGVRADYFALTGQTVVDPRGTLSYTFPTKTTLFGGAGVYHKVPEPWQYSPSSGNPNLFMERAEHYGGGIEQELGDWLFKVEAYRHYYTDIVVVDPYITTPYRVNSHPYERYTEPILLDDRLGYSNDGTGFSEGYEIYIKKSKPPEANGWYGWISYTWSRSLRNDHQHILTDEESRLLRTKDELRIISQYDNTKDVYADFDRTHIINVIFGYKFNREWQVGLRWRYQTSSPTTPIIDDDGGLQQNRGRTIFDPVYSDLTNSKRFKPYHQLDIRIDRFFHYGWGYGNFFVEALNLYVRRNQTGESWDRARPYSTTNPSPQYDFQILENKVDGKKYWFPFLNVGIEMKF